MKNYKRKRRIAAVKAVLVPAMCLLIYKEAGAIGQSAVPTLTIPVGARSTAMGEAFTGLANDASAMFYNPAGLGQSPLTLSWKTHMGDSAFTAVAARSTAEFGSRGYVWAGTHGGIRRFNGKIWEKGEVYLPEENESLRSVALKYFNTDEKKIIDNAVWEIRRANKLGMKRYERLVELLEANTGIFKDDTVRVNAVEEQLTEKPSDESDIDAVEPVDAETAKIHLTQGETDIEGDLVDADLSEAAQRDSNQIHNRKTSKEKIAEKAEQVAAPVYSVTRFDPKSYAKMLILLPPNETSSGHIATQVLPKSMDPQARKKLADDIVDILGMEDRGISHVTELAIPFTVAVRDTVTAMALDASERLWVGTVAGLWRYHSGKWQLFTTENGLPSDRITAIAVSPGGNVAVATEMGLALMMNLEWSSFTSENGLPDSYITSAAFVGNEHLYIGTPGGLARKSSAGNEFTTFDTSSGLLSLGVTALLADSKGQLWIGGDNGITIYSGARNWTRYRFPGSTVYSFAEQSNGTVWIGTNKGVITHKSGKKATVDRDGKAVNAPEWKTYHSKNALKNDNVRAVTACGKDMWVATDGALHQYAHAETQVLLFYEQLMPALKFTDLWHGFPGVVIPSEDWGTIGLSMNFLNMGENDQYDELEEYMGRSKSWEGVFGLSYGFPIKEDLSLGINAKYVVSVLDASVGGIGQTFAIDAAILKRNLLIDRFDIGFMMQNMGPKIYYKAPEEADPIPFSLRLGLAYKPIQTPFHELTLAADACREVVRTYYDKGPDPFWVALWTGMLHNTESSFKEEIQEINVSLGLEYMYADFMALRTGFLGDYVGERYELSMGIGVKYANMKFDFSYIYSPPGFMGGLLRTINEEKEGSTGVRDGQWRISFLFGL